MKIKCWLTPCRYLFFSGGGRDQHAGFETSDKMMDSAELVIDARMGSGASDAEHPRSLEGLNSTVPVPPPRARFWDQLRAFAGPAFLVSVGYMDPGNWATDLQ